MGKKQKYSYYSDILPQEIEWLWHPYIPYGKLTVLQGDPGDGKSTLAIQIAAIVSNGGTFIDGQSISGKQNVIYQCAEDDASDTIIHRLNQAHADCDRVLFINEDEEQVTLDDTRIEETITAVGAKLVIIDPLQAYIPQDGDMQSASYMRGIMRRLAGIAQRNNCAILLIGHMNKSSGSNKLYRGLGSIDIAAIARSVLMICRDEQDPTIRYMYPVKSNLAPEGEAICFTLCKDTGFCWIGKSILPSSNPGRVAADKKSKIEKTKEYLRILLSNGDLPSAGIIEKLQELGISDKTTRKAQKEMGILSRKIGSVWYWHYPTATEDE